MRLNVPHDGRFDAPVCFAQLIVPGFDVGAPRFEPSFNGIQHRRSSYALPLGKLAPAGLPQPSSHVD